MVRTQERYDRVTKYLDEVGEEKEWNEKSEGRRQGGIISNKRIDAISVYGNSRICYSV